MGRDSERQGSEWRGSEWRGSEWRDCERWELMGLLDDAGMDWLRTHHSEVCQTLRNHEHTANLDPDLVYEFDIGLEWLLRSTGVPV